MQNVKERVEHQRLKDLAAAGEKGSPAQKPAYQRSRLPRSALNRNSIPDQKPKNPRTKAKKPQKPLPLTLQFIT